MAIRTTLNELFVRLTDDGTAIKGVHAADRTAVLDETGAEVKSWMESPRAVDPADAAALGPIGKSLNLAALKTVDDLTYQVAAVTKERDNLSTAKDTAESQGNAARERVTELEAALVTSKEQAAKITAEATQVISTLQSQIQALESQLSARIVELRALQQAPATPAA